MDAQFTKDLATVGCYSAIGFSAVGSALGAFIAGSAAIGAWKKCYLQNKPAQFLMLTFAGAPLAQTIYGLILMIVMKGKVEAHPEMWALFLLTGIFSGMVIGFSALYQGKCGASACDAYGETGKGFANYLMIIGIIETVAIFAMVAGLLIVG
jgi:V/A-type H+-transporting ATPase subunit K